jgi:SAM-dependent methyltransferase
MVELAAYLELVHNSDIDFDVPWYSADTPGRRVENYMQRHSPALALRDFVRNKDVYDVGAGLGGNRWLLNHMGAKSVTAIESNKTFADFLRANAKYDDVIETDATNYPFASGSVIYDNLLTSDTKKEMWAHIVTTDAVAVCGQEPFVFIDSNDMLIFSKVPNSVTSQSNGKTIVINNEQCMRRYTLLDARVIFDNSGWKLAMIDIPQHSSFNLVPYAFIKN